MEADDVSTNSRTNEATILFADNFAARAEQPTDLFGATKYLPFSSIPVARSSWFFRRLSLYRTEKAAAGNQPFARAR